MVSYFMQKGHGQRRKDEKRRGGIGDTRDLAQSALLSALRSERESVFNMETTEISLQINNTDLSDFVESHDDLVGELNDRVAVFEEDRFVLREESNLIAIGWYVDQLKERLSSSPVARRDQ